MSKLLDEYPLLVIPSLAKAIGLNEAIVLQQVHYWLNRSDKVRDGAKWVYNTYAQWAEEFPFWSQETVERTIRHLEKRGLLISTDRYNGVSTNRTKWYTIDYAEFNRLTEGEEAESVNSTPSADQDALFEENNLTPSIEQVDPLTTETTTENTSETPTETTTTIATATQTPAREAPPPTTGGDSGSVLIQGIELPLHIAQMEPGELLAREGYAMTRMLADALDDWLQCHPREEVNAAIYNASMQNVRRPSYINATLQRWRLARSPAEQRHVEQFKRQSAWDEIEH